MTGDVLGMTLKGPAKFRSHFFHPVTAQNSRKFLDGEVL